MILIFASMILIFMSMILIFVTMVPEFGPPGGPPVERTSINVSRSWRRASGS